MGKVIPMPAGLHASIRQIAEETGFDRDTVAKKISERSCVPSGKRGGHPVYRLRDVLPALYVLTADGLEDPQKMDPFRRVAHYKAELDRLKLEQETRELIPRIEVEQEQARILKIIAQLMDTLPDIVERDCGATADQVKRIERATDEAREHVFQELAEDEHAPAAIREGA
jgi:hypothetical protein